MVMVLLVFLVACSGYVTPDDEFLNSSIRFPEKKYDKKGLTPKEFSSSVAQVMIAGKKTEIQGWKKDDNNLVFHASIGGVAYGFIFSELMTSSDNKKITSLRSIEKNGETINPKDVLINILGD
jgi:hypothetical protein